MDFATNLLAKFKGIARQSNLEANSMSINNNRLKSGHATLSETLSGDKSSEIKLATNSTELQIINAQEEPLKKVIQSDIYQGFSLFSHLS